MLRWAGIQGEGYSQEINNASVSIWTSQLASLAWSMHSRDSSTGPMDTATSKPDRVSRHDEFPVTMTTLGGVFRTPRVTIGTCVYRGNSATT